MHSYMRCDFTGWSSRTSSTREMVISFVLSHSHCSVRKMIDLVGPSLLIFLRGVELYGHRDGSMLILLIWTTGYLSREGN